jgi:hypothetical protein
MTDEEIRQLQALIDRALDTFRPYSVAHLTANETRARLSLAAAKRQLGDEMGERSRRKR